ncbi:MAG: GNAT family N-acetyltransferase [Bacteroidia bacterium]|nr:GNAT family N-acetyltransferase [Bacteroidia bacterium]NNJ56224.1 N-acetyltransferase [Bacteroidia bacterium]
MQGLEIRPASSTDSVEIADIYNYYIDHTIVTFETTPISAEEMQQRIEKISNQFPYLVAIIDTVVVGYAYASTWKPRAAYNFAVETSIYLKNGYEGSGIGTKLYSKLIDEVRSTDVKTAIGGVSLPNQGSIVLHEKLGFKKIGVFSRVGFKFQKWIDVGYWQLHF